MSASLCAGRQTNGTYERARTKKKKEKEKRERRAWVGMVPDSVLLPRFREVSDVSRPTCAVRRG